MLPSLARTALGRNYLRRLQHVRLFSSANKSKSASENTHQTTEDASFEPETEAKKSSKGAGIFWSLGLFAGLGGAAYYFMFRSNKAGTTIDALLDQKLADKLLPDQVLDPNHPRPYTLVIDLDKFLVCHLWDHRENRWRIAKRPGAELFLFYAAQLYEVVVYSSLPSHEGDVVVKKLDPFGCITYALYRSATESFQGTAVKDISRLNRNLDKVIVIGHDTKGFGKHPDNLLPTQPWLGDPKDASLEEAVDFLEALALSRPKDIRPIISRFNSQSFPQSFDALQAETFEDARAVRMSRMQARNNNPLFRFFGMTKSSASLAAENPSYWDKKRDRMELRRKEYAHAKEMMTKQLEAELAKEKAYYQEHKMSLLDMVSPSSQPVTSNASTETN